MTRSALRSYFRYISILGERPSSLLRCRALASRYCRKDVVTEGRANRANRVVSVCAKLDDTLTYY